MSQTECWPLETGLSGGSNCRSEKIGAPQVGRVASGSFSLGKGKGSTARTVDLIGRAVARILVEARV